VLFAILTLFPEAIEPYTRSSILGIAQEKGLARIRLVDFRDFARDRHRTVDDRPFGGGPGMVLKPEPIVDCVDWLERRHGRFRRLLLCPGGASFRQGKARELAAEERILLLCGRYEGFDERIRSELEWDEISLGDFVLSGGELPALAIVEAVTRLLPGVLGDPSSASEDSFERDGQLDHPHYTRPRAYRGHEVPAELLSGDHRAVREWRARAALLRSRARGAAPAEPNSPSTDRPTSPPRAPARRSPSES
jgi:tRNA (guanine37-N1)-methyltransferase